jgi:hypothetical protein
MREGKNTGVSCRVIVELPKRNLQYDLLCQKCEIKADQNHFFFCLVPIWPPNVNMFFHMFMYFS